MSTNFNRRTSHETSCCEIRSSFALGGSESQSFWCVPWNERSTENWSRVFVQNHHMRWIMVLRVWPGDRATIKSMEKCIICETKKARQVKSNVKTMLICFFDIKGLVYFEFVPQGQTVNQQFYLELLKRFRDVARRNRPELWRSGEWLLHHDRAPAHTAPWHPAIFSCFQEWRGTLKESVFRM